MLAELWKTVCTCSVVSQQRPSASRRMALGPWLQNMPCQGPRGFPEYPSLPILRFSRQFSLVLVRREELNPFGALPHVLLVQRIVQFSPFLATISVCALGSWRYALCPVRSQVGLGRWLDAANRTPAILETEGW